jgi:hypothetical protein
METAIRSSHFKWSRELYHEDGLEFEVRSDSQAILSLLVHLYVSALERRLLGRHALRNNGGRKAFSKRHRGQIG